MTQPRFVPTSFAASAVLLVALLAPSQARALQECSQTSDCDKGLECTVVGSSGCAPSACPPGASCPAPEPCEVTEEKACTPAHCSSSAECGAGMECHEWSQPCLASDCACSSDQPECSCPETTCDPKTESYCTPKYVLPCAVAADCGEGFSCEEQQSCGCSGSAGTGGAPTPVPGGAGAAPAPFPEGGAGAPAADPLPLPTPDCSCAPSGEFRCVANEIVCQADSECPTGWLCQQGAVTTSPACPKGQDCVDPEPLPEPSRLCMPEFYGGAGGVDLSGAAQGTPTAAGSDKGSSANPELANNGDGDTESRDSAACQMGHAPASSGALSLLALLGALFGLKRRRAQG